MTGYRHVQNRGNVGSVIAAVCFTLFIFSLAVVLVLNAGWLYELEIRLLDLEKTAGMSAEEIRLNYQALIFHCAELYPFRLAQLYFYIFQ